MEDVNTSSLPRDVRLRSAENKDKEMLGYIQWFFQAMSKEQIRRMDIFSDYFTLFEYCLSYTFRKFSPRRKTTQNPQNLPTKAEKNLKLVWSWNQGRSNNCSASVRTQIGPVGNTLKEPYGSIIGVRLKDLYFV